MGIKTVAVYSEADSNNPYLKEVDEAYPIGPPSPKESYLKGNTIISIALDCKADAVHPGYGFLSEDPHFARACRESGLIFIGPRPEAIQAMGKKIRAREIMASKGIPVIKGSCALESAEQAMRVADEIGYPVLLKASGGGGGIGMEVVKGPEQIKKAFEKCRSRAKASFGDESVYLEKYLASPRHIEIQIVADQFGNVWHLGERDCSVQRRHQKVIEESPSPAVTEKIRAKMGDDAVRAASAIGYDSVGTVEMMMDENKNYYFLEMNTRIQVEHGVTELRTGTDLVELQILSAAGEHLVAGNKSASGHCIECRIYAENPLTFLPSCGVIQELRFPSGNGIRIDHSIEKGFSVTPYYDPLLAKVMVWSENRKTCIRKMWSALDATTLLGISTNIPFLMRVLEDEEFIDRGATTLLTDKILSKMKSTIQPAKAV
jgi:acetyl-CoA carboxylase biotin carboxylase subunit